MCKKTKKEMYDNFSLKDISDKLKTVNNQSKDDYNKLLFYRYFELKDESCAKCRDEAFSFNDLMTDKISLVKASLMNDRLDSTVNVDFTRLKSDTVEYCRNNKKTVFCHDLRFMGFKDLYFVRYADAGKLESECTKSVMDIIYDKIRVADKNCDEAKKGLNDYLKSVLNVEELIDRIVNKVIASYKNYDYNIEQRAEGWVNALKNTPKTRFLRSLSTNFENDAMWAYYANNNGVCVRYNFNKLKYITDEAALSQLDYITLRKVVYYKKGEKPKFNAIKYLNAFFAAEEEPDNLDIYCKIFENQIVSKDISWAPESEWRLIYYNAGSIKNMSYSESIDLVDAVYIDESVFNTCKAKRILKKAAEKGWEVYKRVISPKTSDYIYQKVCLINDD